MADLKYNEAFSPPPENVYVEGGCCTWKPCAHGHTFNYTGGDTGERIPEGVPCECGAMLSHWRRCGECGQDVFSPVMRGL